MRRPVTTAALGLLSAAAMISLAAAQAPAKSAPGPQVVTIKEVELNTAADLEHLRETNLRHYLRARQILAAANELCRPILEPTFRVSFIEDEPACGPMWMTSLPPKKVLRFRLDGVYYSAIVSITNLTAKPLQVVQRPKR